MDPIADLPLVREQLCQTTLKEYVEKKLREQVLDSLIVEESNA